MTIYADDKNCSLAAKNALRIISGQKGGFMADVQGLLIYKFTVSSRELKVIRRALEAFGGPGSDLARQITEKIEKSQNEIKMRFQTALKEMAITVSDD